ncbi:MAG: MerR family transcriptional regulator [Caulobacterales bacterium]|nr:MerR family transcriptional regulator [Caulobacterales bacterium]MCA0373211.1 MerR family transcriptional regulator [Pseudomonadota bacterium]
MTLTPRDRLLIWSIMDMRLVLKDYSVKQLSDLAKISIRTLHYYDEIGLLKPSYKGANNYRYYSETDALKLQQIMFFKEMGFSLKKSRTL